MDGFAKNLSSPTPIKSSAIPRASPSDLQQKMCSSKEPREVNENEQDFHHQMGSKLQNLNKSATKHFMSPTVSAASKVAVSRKKILTDRNESSGSVISDTHFYTTSRIDSSPAPEDLGLGNSSQITPVSSRKSEGDKNSSDLCSKPYDPLTNYLSPRPKFLRYNPNRRIEILLRRERDLRKWGDGLADTECASLEPQKLVEEEQLGLSSPQGRSIKPEDGSSPWADEFGSNSCRSEETDESEDEASEEAEEEERHWHLSEVLKYLLLLGVLFLSTLYISSMNSPTSPYSLWDLREGYQKIQNHVFLVVMNNSVVGGAFFDQKQDKDLNLEEETQRIINERFGKEEIIKQEMEKTEDISDQMSELLDLQEGETAETSDALQVYQTQFVPDQMNYTEVEYEKPGSFEARANSDQDDFAGVLEVESTYEDEHAKVMEPKSSSTDESSEVLESKSCSNDEQASDEAIPSWNLNQLSTEKATNEENEKEERVNNEEEKAVEVTDGIVETIEPPLGREKIEIFGSLEFPQIQFMYNKISNQNVISDIPITSENEVDSDKGHPEPMKIESISKATMGISSFFVIVASTVLGFLYRKRGKSSAKDSSATIESYSKSMAVEERSSLHEKVESFEEQIEMTDSSVHSEGKVTKEELYQSRAPKVELLGEYVVEDFSSSLKSFSLSSKPMVREASNTTQSQATGLRRTGISPSNYVYPSVTDFSATESPSCGRITSQEKIVRKEEDKYGEDSMKVITTPVRRSTSVTTTPVRRSSRIRNRAVTSP